MMFPKAWFALVFSLMVPSAIALEQPLVVVAMGHPTVRSELGETVYSAAQITRGERSWVTLGKVQGAPRGNSASALAADWLQREVAELHEMRALAAYSRPYEVLQASERERVRATVRDEIRHDNYDAATNTITISSERAAAITEVQRHYMFLLGDAPGYEALRQAHAIERNFLPAAADRKAASAFLFWTAWSNATRSKR